MQGIRMIEQLRFSHDDDVVHGARPLATPPAGALRTHMHLHRPRSVVVAAAAPHHDASLCVMLGVQDEDSRVECDEMAEGQNPADALPTQTAHRESFAPACRLTLVTDP